MRFLLFSLPVVIPSILAIYVLIINLRELENRFFIAYMATMIIGNFISLLTPLAEDLELARWGNAIRLIFVFYLNGILLFFLACSIFYRDIFKRRSFISSLLIAPVLFTFTILTDYFFSTGILYSGVRFEDGIYFTEFGRFRFLNDLYIIFFVLLTLYILIKSYPISDSLKKREIVILSSLILLGAIVSSARPFVKSYPTIILMLATFGPLPIPIAFAYFISRYKLFSPLESALNLAIETLMDGIIVLDQHLRIIKMNPMAEKILGLSFSDIEKKSSLNFQNILEEKFAGEEICYIFRTISHKEYIEVYNKETELIKPKKAFLEINASPIRGKRGHILGTLIKISDITEKKKSEIALHQEKELSASITQFSADAIISTDENGIISSWNKGAEKIYGYTSGEIIGKSIRILDPEQIRNRGKDEEFLKSLKEKGFLTNLERTQVTKDGKDINVQITAFMVRDEMEGKDYYASIVRDVTQTKLMEEELNQSSKLAAIGTLAAGVAHEFNNLLAGILGYAQLGKSSGKIEEMKKSLDIISKSSEKAKNISQNLLTFARRQEPKKELNDIRAIIDNTLSLIERELEKANIKVIRKYRDIPRTVCDFGQISQVFLNIMTNARDAMIPKGGILTIETNQDEQNIEISFSDTGCGIPKNLIDKIFEPFMTTKGARGGSKIPGTGLGLSVSYGIIKNHNGEIKVQSKLGEGSRFVIKLPIITTQTLEVSHTLQTDPAESLEFPKSLKTLVVDDEEVIRDLLKDILENEGFEVITKSDADSALDLFKKEKFNILFTDITMPGMDGINLLKEIRKLNQDIPVILITGKVTEEKSDLENIILEEASGFIKKPFNISEIRKVILETQRKKAKA